MRPDAFFHLGGLGTIPSIRKHTDEQLAVAIKEAERLPDFYVLLHGIDAFMERRRRRARAAREEGKGPTPVIRIHFPDENNWGDSKK